MHASKAKQGIHSPLAISRQMFSHLQESRAPSCLMVTWEDKCHHSEHLPPSFFFPQVNIAEHDVIQYGISLWSAVLAVSPPNFLCTPSFLAGGVV